MTTARPVRAAAGSPEFLAILDTAVPALPGHDHARPMCAAWDDHRHWSRCCIRGFETMGNQHDQTCVIAPPPAVVMTPQHGETLGDRVRRTFGWAGPTQQDYRAVEGPR